MLKRLVILLLEFGAGLGGNLTAGAIQGEVWQNVFTPGRIVGTAIGIGLMLLLLASLESDKVLRWSWRWHRFWYLWEIRKDTDLQRWEEDFAYLEMTLRAIESHTSTLIIGKSKSENQNSLQKTITRRDKTSHRLLILGDPGSGKTTAMQWLTLELGRSGTRRLGFASPMPILVQLGNFQAESMLEYIGEAMCHQTKRRSGKILAKGIEGLLERGQLVLLLDALDEALGGRRELVLAQLADLLNSKTFKDTPIIITARTREDPGGRLIGLKVYEIQELTDKSVKKIIRAYSQYSHATEIEDLVTGRPYIDWFSGSKNYHVKEIKERLTGLGLLGTHGLARNPFWLRLILENGAFEGNKGRIVHKAVNTLLEREWNKPIAQRSWEHVSPKEEQLQETMQALAWLAYRMSVEEQTAIDLDNALNMLNTWLTNRVGFSALTPQDILGLARDAQLLNYDASTTNIRSLPMRFRHRLLQEFLTAWALNIHTELLTQDLLTQAVGNNEWRETLLMLGGLVNNLEVLIQTILENNPTLLGVILSIGLLQSVDELNKNMAQKLIMFFAENLRQSFTQEHKKAIVEMARLAHRVFIEVLFNLLHNYEQQIKVITIELLKDIGSEESAKVLIGLLKDTFNSDLVSGALVSIGEPAVKPLIKEMGNRWDWLIQMKVAVVLVDIGQPAVEPLINALHEEGGGSAAKVLSRLRDRRAVEPIITMLRSVGFEYRQQAAEALGDIGDVRASGPLIESLKDKIPIVRIKSAEALGKIGHQKAIEGLVGALNDTFWQVRKNAAEALGKIGNDRATGPLINALRDAYKGVRQSAAEALCKIGMPAVEQLMQSVNDNDWRVQTSIITILGKIGDQRPVGVLVEILNQGNWRVQRIAIETLGLIGNNQVLFYLERFLREANQNSIKDEILIDITKKAIILIRKRCGSE